MWTLLHARSTGDVLRCRSGIDEESAWVMAAGNAVFAALVFAICQRLWGLTLCEYGFSLGSSYGVTGLRWWARLIWAADA